VDNADSVQFCHTLTNFAKRKLGQRLRDQTEASAMFPQLGLLRKHFCHEVQIAHVFKRVKKADSRQVRFLAVNFFNFV